MSQSCAPPATPPPAATTGPTQITTLSADWAVLLQAALVGDSHPWAWPAPADPRDAVALLLRQASHAPAQADNRPEAQSQLLRLAGVLAWCQRSGWVAAARPASASLLAPPRPETRQPAPPAWTGLWQQAHAMDLARLQAEVLRGMNQQQFHAPVDVLPTLLQLGRQSVAMRPFIEPVLGERGRWLADLNPDWAWGRGAQEESDTDTQWQHGSIDQRRAVLLGERHSAPEAARERLQAAWGELPARDRHALISTLAVGLSASDEAFLTQQLQKDRAQDVRRSAADLLSALPGSAYSARMVARLQPLVQVLSDTADLAAAPSLKSRLKKAVATLGRQDTAPPLKVNRPVKLHIEAPPEPVASAPAAAVTTATAMATTVQPSAPALPDDPFKTDWPDGERPRHESLGQRAWLLFVLVRRSPLPWWTQHTGLSPVELIAAIDNTDWTEALVRGWAYAALQQPEPAWTLALLAHPRIERWGDVTALHARLSPEQQEQHLLAQWTAEAAVPAGMLQTLLDASLKGTAPYATWGTAMSAHVAGVLQQHSASGNLHPALQTDDRLGQRLTDLASVLHPDSLGVLAALPATENDSSRVSERLRTIHHIAHTRQTLHRWLAPTTPS